MARLVLMDTGVFTGEQEMSEAWHRFADFVDREDELPVGFLVRRGCATDPGDEVAAAYDAPFPSEASKAGARAFPAILPLSPSDPGAKAGQQGARRAARRHAPDADAVGRRGPPAAAARRARRFAAELGQPAPRVIEGAGHFLQEDRGAEIGEIDRRLARNLKRLRAWPLVLGGFGLFEDLVGGRGARVGAGLVGGAGTRVGGDDAVGVHRPRDGLAPLARHAPRRATMIAGEALRAPRRRSAGP